MSSNPKKRRDRSGTICGERPGKPSPFLTPTGLPNSGLPHLLQARRRAKSLKASRPVMRTRLNYRHSPLTRHNILKSPSSRQSPSTQGNGSSGRHSSSPYPSGASSRRHRKSSPTSGFSRETRSQRSKPYRHGRRLQLEPPRKKHRSRDRGLGRARDPAGYPLAVPGSGIHHANRRIPQRAQDHYTDAIHPDFDFSEIESQFPARSRFAISHSPTRDSDHHHHRDRDRDRTERRSKKSKKKPFFQSSPVSLDRNCRICVFKVPGFDHPENPIQMRGSFFGWGHRSLTYCPRQRFHYRIERISRGQMLFRLQMKTQDFGIERTLRIDLRDLDRETSRIGVVHQVTVRPYPIPESMRPRESPIPHVSVRDRERDFDFAPSDPLSRIGSRSRGGRKLLDPIRRGKGGNGKRSRHGRGHGAGGGGGGSRRHSNSRFPKKKKKRRKKKRGLLGLIRPRRGNGIPKKHQHQRRRRTTGAGEYDDLFQEERGGDEEGNGFTSASTSTSFEDLPSPSPTTLGAEWSKERRVFGQFQPTASIPRPGEPILLPLHVQVRKPFEIIKKELHVILNHCFVGRAENGHEYPDYDVVGCCVRVNSAQRKKNKFRTTTLMYYSPKNI